MRIPTTHAGASTQAADLAPSVFENAGEMAGRCRAFDWAATPLGPVDNWSLSLRTAVGIVLASRNPMFLWWGPDLVQIYNDAYRPSLGQGDRHPAALGARGREFWTDVWEAIGPQIDQVMTTGEATWHEDQYLPIQRNGRLEDVWWTYSYGPVRDDDGRINGTLVICQETTHRILAEHDRERLLAESENAREEAETARVDAEAANRAKGEFLAVMSHELRTPLNAIGGYAELMAMELHGPVTEQQHADLARIQQSQKHLLGLINQVLNYTRVETGILHYELTDVPVSEALAAAEALVMPQVRAKGLTYLLAGCAPALRVRADREKLQQILLNLLANAIKFTDAGEIRIACVAGPGTAAISVADTGRGIAADKLTRVFEPFVQVDQRLTRPHEGVGLGLAISRDLARGMRGDLAVESIVGVGSTFTLTLPAA
jgi:signal transduction histidine kinase